MAMNVPVLYQDQCGRLSVRLPWTEEEFSSKTKDELVSMYREVLRVYHDDNPKWEYSINTADYPRDGSPTLADYDPDKVTVFYAKDIPLPIVVEDEDDSD